MSFPVTIYHTPACSKSRATLALIEAAGHVPTVIDYKKQGWGNADALCALLAAAGLTPRQALRREEALAKALGLDAEGVADAVILDAMVAHPALVNRPIVQTPKGTRLCRPPELVAEIL